MEKEYLEKRMKDIVDDFQKQNNISTHEKNNFTNKNVLFFDTDIGDFVLTKSGRLILIKESELKFYLTHKPQPGFAISKDVDTLVKRLLSHNI